MERQLCQSVICYELLAQLHLLSTLKSHQKSAHIPYYWTCRVLFLDSIKHSHLLATKNLNVVHIKNYLHKHKFSWKLILEKSS